jgi:hypothetical protein
MQAAMCLVDWTAAQLRAAGPTKFTARKVYGEPTAPASIRAKVAALLKGVIEGGPARESLTRHTATALQLSDEEMATICWEQPRSLFLEVVPTAFRRLQSQWGRYSDGEVEVKADAWHTDAPLPEFIPRTLFSDLCLPEVVIDPPDDYDRAADTAMPVAQALNELAPGRVTLRWAVKKVKGLWIEPAVGEELALESQLAATAEILGVVTNLAGNQVPLVRPTCMRPSTPDAGTLPSSNGFLHWEFEASPVADGFDLIRPRSGPLVEVVESITAYLHAGRGALRTWRFALKATSEVARRSGRERTVQTFTWRGKPAAVGYEAIVDALRLVVRPPTVDSFDLDGDERRLRQLRRDRFAHDLQRSLEYLDLNPFLATWVTEVVLGAAALCIQRGLPIASLLGLSRSQWGELASEAVQDVLLVLDSTEEDEEAPLREAVLEAVSRLDVIASIDAALPRLCERPDSTWEPWLRARFLQTLAAAIQAAAGLICPDFDAEDDCVLDVVDDEGHVAIIISDSSIGGGGLIEALAGRISDDPRRFDQLVVAALEPSDLEEADASLPRALGLLKSDTTVSSLAATFRSASASRLDSWRDVTSSLVRRGVSPTHATLSTLLSRVFRPGSSTSSDELLRICLARWTSMEESAGFAIDQRSAAAVLARDAAVQVAIAAAVPGGNPKDVTWVQVVLLGLLWVRSEERRPTSLRATNWFVRNPPATERTLVLDVIGKMGDAVSVTDPGWRELLAERLGALGRCRLASSPEDHEVLKSALVHLETRPLELGWLLVHPRVEGITRGDGLLSIEVSLEEAAQ